MSDDGPVSELTFADETDCPTCHAVMFDPEAHARWHTERGEVFNEYYEPFVLDNFIDAATGAPAVEVIGENGPGHYHLSPRPEVDASGVLGEDRGDARDQLYPSAEENFWDDRTHAESEESPSAGDMLRGLMQTPQDPTELSVNIPVKKLMAVLVEIGNLERKGRGNGQAAMEKTQELVRLRAELSRLQHQLESTQSVIGSVWELIEVWEGPTVGPNAPSREGAAKLRKVLVSHLTPGSTPPAITRVRRLFSMQPDSPVRILWRDGVECVEVPVADLRTALDDLS